MNESVKPVDDEVQAIISNIWSKCLTLSIELQYKKSKYNQGRYDALAELWNEIKAGVNHE